jgi:DNA-binding CsgD family transcriptional regulator
MDVDSFSHVIAQIYDASLDIQRWDSALATVAGLFNSPMAQISYYTSFQDASPFFKLWGPSDGSLERAFPRYRELALTDPRFPPRLFKAYHCRQILSDEALWSSEIYQQALAPAGIEYSMYFGLELDDGAKCAVGVTRGRDRAPYTVQDCDDFGRLIPHISRAVTMHGTLRRAHATVAAAQALIDGVPLGMMVVDDDRVVLANSEARSLLGEGTSLRCSGGRLQATTAAVEAKLVRAISEARDGRDKAVGVTLPAGEAGQVRAVIRRLLPPAVEMFGAGRGALALYLADSRRPAETSEEVLQRLFGLTGREAAVLHALVQGHDTRRIASRLDIGPETVKSHLQHIMQSAGVSRRSELIRLVLSSPAWLSGRDSEATFIH